MPSPTCPPDLSEQQSKCRRPPPHKAAGRTQLSDVDPSVKTLSPILRASGSGYKSQGSTGGCSQFLNCVGQFFYFCPKVQRSYTNRPAIVNSRPPPSPVTPDREQRICSYPDFPLREVVPRDAVVVQYFSSVVGDSYVGVVHLDMH